MLEFTNLSSIPSVLKFFSSVIIENMHFIIRSVSLGILFVVVGCGNPSSSGSKLNHISQNQLEITHFSFLVRDNPELNSNVVMEFDQTNKIFRGIINENLPVTSLIANFAFVGSHVKIDNIEQVSGQTSNDFTNQVIYKVYNQSNQSVLYTVNLVKFTGLPILEIYTNNFESVDSRNEYIDARITIDGWRYFNNLSVSDIEIRGRGHSTWDWYPKKPYQIKFLNDKEILGMPPAKRWILLAEYADKTLMRNKIAFEIGKLSNLSWVPSSEFIELFINDEYQGTYNLTEKIEIHENRLEPSENEILLEIDQPERLSGDSTYFMSNFFLFNIKDPNIKETDPEFVEIKDKLLEFEDALINQRWSTDSDGYKSMVDLESFVTWFLVNEITKNIDAGAFYSSVYLTINSDEKIALGPIWDFDLSMASSYEDWWMRDTPWFQLMLLDPDFVSLVQQRFSLMNTNRGYVIDKINSFREYLHLSAVQNDLKWKTLGTYIFPNPTYFETYDEEVLYLKGWLENRMDWLEREMVNL